MYALIEHEANFQDYKDLMPGMLATGSIEEMASAMERECNSVYEYSELTDIYDETVGHTDIKARVLEHGLRHVQVDNDSNTVLSIVEIPRHAPAKQYLAVQSGSPGGVSAFADGTGNTNLYASAEETREEIAHEIERLSENESISIEDITVENPQFDPDPGIGMFENIVRMMPGEAGASASIHFPDGEERTYTVVEITL